MTLAWPGSPKRLASLLRQRAVELPAGQQPRSGERQQHTDREAEPGQYVGHERPGAEADYGAGDSEQDDETGRYRRADQERAAEASQQRRPALDVLVRPDVQAHVGWKHGEPTGVEGCGDAGGKGEAQRRDQPQASEV